MPRPNNRQHAHVSLDIQKLMAGINIKHMLSWSDNQPPVYGFIVYNKAS